MTYSCGLSSAKHPIKVLIVFPALGGGHMEGSLGASVIPTELGPSG